jgi:hypothetical protein
VHEASSSPHTCLPILDAGVECEHTTRTSLIHSCKGTAGMLAAAASGAAGSSKISQLLMRGSMHTASANLSTRVGSEMGWSSHL